MFAEGGRAHHDKDERREDGSITTRLTVERTETPLARMNITRTDASNMTRMNIKRTELPMAWMRITRTDATIMTMTNITRLRALRTGRGLGLSGRRCRRSLKCAAD